MCFQIDHRQNLAKQHALPRNREQLSQNDCHQLSLPRSSLYSSHAFYRPSNDDDLQYYLKAGACLVAITECQQSRNKMIQVNIR